MRTKRSDPIRAVCALLAAVASTGAGVAAAYGADHRAGPDLTRGHIVAADAQPPAAVVAAALERTRADAPAAAGADRRRAPRADADVQIQAPWDLDRLDQDHTPSDGTYSYGPTGAGVTAYVFDTGIRATHHEFGGRVGRGFSTIHDGRGTGDCSGHGTHVAGTIGGATYGVAKAVRLVPVRVLDCAGTGTIADLIAGIDWVTAHHHGPSVANLSLSAAPSPALDRAVARSIASGVTYVVSAGNDDADACATSPARVPGAITVAASTADDQRASDSNYGRCVDLFAPGTDILSAGRASDTATAVRSGTSMAAPHVTGVIATYLQHARRAQPAQAWRALRGAAVGGVLTEAGPGSPNALLHVLP